jgi:hypothetical protein
MVETKNFYCFLDESQMPDRFVTSLLNTLKANTGPDSAFEKLRGEGFNSNSNAKREFSKFKN